MIIQNQHQLHHDQEFENIRQNIQKNIIISPSSILILKNVILDTSMKILEIVCILYKISKKLILL